MYWQKNCSAPFGTGSGSVFDLNKSQERIQSSYYMPNYISIHTYRHMHERVELI